MTRKGEEYIIVSLKLTKASETCNRVSGAFFLMSANLPMEENGREKMAVKYVFVTGGVVSGLGKGITAASLGRLLKARGYQVTMQKLDPYINVDPGTMNPIQHGEVFVTDDGRKQIWIWDITKGSSMNVWIKIPMLPPGKYTGPFCKKSGGEITEAERYR